MNKQEMNELVARKAALFMQVFTTTAGKEVLTELKKAYRGGNVFDPDPTILARTVGAFEVVQGIVELVDRGIADANK